MRFDAIEARGGGSSSGGVNENVHIFDDIAHELDDPPQQDETAFAYLNRSGRAEAERVRQLVVRWFDHYPAEKRDGLLARFRSPIDDQHDSAFFELFLHEFVLTCGHKIVAIEPLLAGTRKSPDFLVESVPGGRFYLEAVLATGRSQEEARAQARLNQALAAVDKTPSPGHFVDLYVRGVPGAPITIKKLTVGLRQWIAGLPDDRGAFEVVPFVFEEHGLYIRLHAWPRHNPERAARAIGVRHFPHPQEKAYDDIRDALEKKASRYGALDHPYVVAVNAMHLFQHADAVMDAVLGTPLTAVRIGRDGKVVAEDDRRPDGVWYGPRGPRKKGLSAVLLTGGINPWNFASHLARLVRNPWASKPLPRIALGIDEFNPVDGSFYRIDGAKLGSIFGLPKGWPED